MKWGFAELNVIELVGTTAVVLSLIFVGVGVRDSNKEARAATIQTSLNAEMHLQEVAAQHAAVWDKLVRGEPLETGEESRRGIILYNMLMTESENRYYQVYSGFLDTQTWDGRVESLAPLVKLPIYDLWKATPGSKNHTADFLEFLEDLREDGHD